MAARNVWGRARETRKEKGESRKRRRRVACAGRERGKIGFSAARRKRARNGSPGMRARTRLRKHKEKERRDSLSPISGNAIGRERTYSSANNNGESKEKMTTLCTSRKGNE